MAHPEAEMGQAHEGAAQHLDLAHAVTLGTLPPCSVLMPSSVGQGQKEPLTA